MIRTLFAAVALLLMSNTSLAGTPVECRMIADTVMEKGRRVMESSDTGIREIFHKLYQDIYLNCIYTPHEDVVTPLALAGPLGL